MAIGSTMTKLIRSPGHRKKKERRQKKLFKTIKEMVEDQVNKTKKRWW